MPSPTRNPSTVASRGGFHVANPVSPATHVRGQRGSRRQTGETCPDNACGGLHPQRAQQIRPPLQRHACHCPQLTPPIVQRLAGRVPFDRGRRLAVPTSRPIFGQYGWSDPDTDHALSPSLKRARAPPVAESAAANTALVSRKMFSSGIICPYFVERLKHGCQGLAPPRQPLGDAIRERIHL